MAHWSFPKSDGEKPFSLVIVLALQFFVNAGGGGQTAVEPQKM